MVALIPEFDSIKVFGVFQHPLTKQLIQPKEECKNKTVDAKSITFTHLLTHTSGLPAWDAIYKVNNELLSQYLVDMWNSSTSYS